MSNDHMDLSRPLLADVWVGQARTYVELYFDAHEIYNTYIYLVLKMRTFMGLTDRVL